MNSRFRELRDLIDEYEELVEESSDMYDAWNSDDEYAMAENDPGLQFEKDEEIADKYEEIVELCKTIGGVE